MAKKILTKGFEGNLEGMSALNSMVSHQRVIPHTIAYHFKTKNLIDAKLCRVIKGCIFTTIQHLLDPIDEFILSINCNKKNGIIFKSSMSNF